MKTRNLVLGIALAAMAAAQPLSAADSTASLSVTAAVNATAKLTLGAASISFPDADPDTTPSIPATAALSVVAKGKTSRGSSISLTVRAGGDLTSGLDTIPIGNVSWTTGSTGFVAGTMSSTADVSVGTWANSGNRPGSLSFVLANNWDYAVGTYSATAVFTLVAP